MPTFRDSRFELTKDDREQADEQLREQQRTIHFDTKEFTVEILVHKYKNDDLYIPDYQRKDVWSDGKKSKFVESVLLGLPIPFMFGADVPMSGRIEIVDGAQRIYTLTGFLNNELILTDIEKLTFLSDFKFKDLSIAQQRRLKNRTLRMVVLSEQADKTTRFDIFERINTGSLLLVPSELRRGAFQGPFYDFLHECAKRTDFLALCRMSRSLHKRAENEELALRFFAYAERYRQFRHDVTRFLNEYLVDKNRGFDHVAKQAEFDRMVEFVSTYFPYGFAKTTSATSTPRVRFEAISVGVHLALEEDPSLVPSNMDWLESQDFKRETTTHASNSAPRLRARIEYVRDALQGK